VPIAFSKENEAVEILLRHSHLALTSWRLSMVKSTLPIWLFGTHHWTYDDGQYGTRQRKNLTWKVWFMSSEITHIFSRLRLKQKAKKSQCSQKSRSSCMYGVPLAYWWDSYHWQNWCKYHSPSPQVVHQVNICISHTLQLFEKTMILCRVWENKGQRKTWWNFVKTRRVSFTWLKLQSFTFDTSWQSGNTSH
jgi:hypothetical protein